MCLLKMAFGSQKHTPWAGGLITNSSALDTPLDAYQIWLLAGPKYYEILQVQCDQSSKILPNLSWGVPLQQTLFTPHCWLNLLPHEMASGAWVIFWKTQEHHKHKRNKRKEAQHDKKHSQHMTEISVTKASQKYTHHRKNERTSQSITKASRESHAKLHRDPDQTSPNTT